jgi:hypothetical protein
MNHIIRQTFAWQRKFMLDYIFLLPKIGALQIQFLVNIYNFGNH